MPDRVWFGDRPLYRRAFRPRYFSYGRAVVYRGYDTLFRLDGSADLFS